jgi:hypothetical protein
LKDTLKFSKLDEDEEKRQCDAGKKLRRGAAGIKYGSPAHLFDASLYTRKAWTEVTTMTMKNCFAKADLGITMEYDDNFNMTDLIMEIDNITTEDLDIFINIDNDDSQEFVKVNIREIEEELVLQEKWLSEDGSVEENLENEGELQETINSSPGWDAVHHLLCKLQNNLYKVPVLNMKR